MSSCKSRRLCIPTRRLPVQVDNQSSRGQRFRINLRSIILAVPSTDTDAQIPRAAVPTLIFAFLRSINRSLRANSIILYDSATPSSFRREARLIESNRAIRESNSINVFDDAMSCPFIDSSTSIILSEGVTCYSSKCKECLFTVAIIVVVLSRLRNKTFTRFSFLRKKKKKNKMANCSPLTWLAEISKLHEITPSPPFSSFRFLFVHVGKTRTRASTPGRMLSSFITGKSALSDSVHTFLRNVRAPRSVRVP